MAMPACDREVLVPTSARGTHIYAAVIALCLFNLLFTGFVAIVNDKTFADALKLYDAAGNLYQDRGFSFQYKDDVRSPTLSPPYPVVGRFFYPYLASRAFFVFGQSVHTANAVSALFRALLVAPLFFLALQLFGFGPAVIVGLLYTLSPFYFEMGVRSMAETTCAFFYYLALWLLVLYTGRPRAWLLPLAGVSLSLAYFTRPEAIFLALIGAAVVWLFGTHRRDLAWFLVPPAAALSGASLVIYGRPVGLESAATPLLTLPRWWDAYALRSYDWQQYLAAAGGLAGALQIRVFNCLRFARNVFSDGILIDTQTGVLPLLFAPALVVPLVSRAPRPRQRLLWLLTGGILLQTLVTIGYPGYPTLSTEVRHGQLLAPWLLILAGAGLVQIWQAGTARLGGRLPWGRLAAGMLAGLYMVFALIAFTNLVNFYLWAPAYRGGVEQGAEWARAELPADAVVMARRATDVRFFAQRVAVVTPSADFAGIMEYAHQNRVTHILLADADRQAVPNLAEGIAAYPQNFIRLHTAASFSLFAVRSYNFGTAVPVVNGDGYFEQSEDQPVALDWSELGRLRQQHSVRDARQTWRQWLDRARVGAWAISGRVPGARQIARPLDLRVGDEVRLIGYDPGKTPPLPGFTIHLTLYWQRSAPVHADYTVFTHVLGPDGRVYAQADAIPVAGTYPTSRWQDGEIVQDEYDIAIPADAPQGAYRLEAGMYLLQTGKRLPITTPDGQRLPDDRVLLNPAP